MFSEQSIIDLLIPTGYTIEEFPATQFDVFEENDIAMPIIYVGYTTIDSSNPGAAIAYDAYNLHGEDLIQSFDIHIVCNKEDLPMIWIKCHQALVGQYPVGYIADGTTSLTFAQGGMVGKSQTNIHWVNRFRIGFPTILTLL